MPSIGWLRDLFVPKDPIERPTFPYDCTVIYADGATDAAHFWAIDADDALRLASYWMPKREATVEEVLIKRRQS